MDHKILSQIISYNNTAKMEEIKQWVHKDLKPAQKQKTSLQLTSIHESEHKKYTVNFPHLKLPILQIRKLFHIFKLKVYDLIK